MEDIQKKFQACLYYMDNLIFQDSFSRHDYEWMEGLIEDLYSSIETKEKCGRKLKNGANIKARE